jgi:hypothetical protein
MRRRWSWLALMGLVTSQVLMSLGGPALIAWWNKPAVATPFACDEAMQVAVAQFVRLSTLCSGGMVLSFVGAGLWWSRRRTAVVPAAAPQVGPPPGP